MTYRSFVANLSNMKNYRQDKERLESELDELLYIMTGVKGVSFDSVMVHGNPSVSEERRLELIEKYNAKEKELKFIKNAISQIEAILARMPEELTEMLILKFVDGNTYRKVGMVYGYSDHGIWVKLKRETEKYL